MHISCVSCVLHVLLVSFSLFYHFIIFSPPPPSNPLLPFQTSGDPARSQVICWYEHSVLCESVFILQTGITSSTFTRLYKNIISLQHIPPNPAAARSLAWVCGRSLLGNAGSNPAGAMDLSPMSVVCRQVDVSATGWLLVQRCLSVISKPQHGPLGLSKKHIPNSYF
jgi:hypothetical protein